MSRPAFVGTKNYDIGVKLAEITKNLHPDGGKICLQTGGAAAANHNERLQGIRDTLSGTSGSTPPLKSADRRELLDRGCRLSADHR